MVNPTSQNIGQVSHTNTPGQKRSQNSLPLPPPPFLKKSSNWRWWGVEMKERVKPDMTAYWQLHLFVDSRRQLTYFSLSRIFILMPSLTKDNCSVVILLCNILTCIKSDRICRSCRKPFPPHLSVARERSRFTFD